MYLSNVTKMTAVNLIVLRQLKWKVILSLTLLCTEIFFPRPSLRRLASQSVRSKQKLITKNVMVLI